MGRGTEFFDYINRDYEPNAEEKLKYTHINEREYFELRKKLARERKKKKDTANESRRF